MRFGGLRAKPSVSSSNLQSKKRFRATTKGRRAIWESAQLQHCDFAFGRPLIRAENVP